MKGYFEVVPRVSVLNYEASSAVVAVDLLRGVLADFVRFLQNIALFGLNHFIQRFTNNNYT